MGGVSFFGISDLPLFLSNKDDPLAPFNIPMYGDMNDPDDRDRLLAQSPIHGLANITAPIFLYHGAKDPLVDISHSDLIASSIKEFGGAIEYHRHPEAGHGFIDAKHEAVVFLEMLLFLDKHMSPSTRRRHT